MKKPQVLLIGGADLKASDWTACCVQLSELGYLADAIDWRDFPWEEGVDRAVEFLSREIAQRESPIVVAHSAAGLLLPRCRALTRPAGEIYLAALIPQPGLSFFEQMFECPIDVFDPAWIAREDRDDHPQARVHQMLYEHVLGPAQTLPSRRAYLACENDQVVRPAWQHWAAQTLMQVEPLSVASGHLPPLETPELLATEISILLNSWISSP